MSLPRSSTFRFSPHSLGKLFLFVTGGMYLAKEFRSLWGQLFGLLERLRETRTE